MKKHTLVAGLVTLFLADVMFSGCGQGGTQATTAGSTNAPSLESTRSLATVASQATDQMTTFLARSGSKMRIEGTANIIHPTWQIESPFIGGLLEVGTGFPIEPGQAVTLGKIEANGKVFISVRSLKSVKEDGSHYDDRMDEVTYEHLKEAQFKQISYKLTELTLKEAAKAKDAPYVFDSTGELTIAGVTKNIAMPVKILPLVNPKGEKQLEITGNVAVKMTDYNVAPVDINLVVGHIKTGAEVKLVFKWIVGRKRATSQ